MSIHLMSQAWRTELPSGRKFVLMAVCDAVNAQSGVGWPSVPKIAKLCGMGERTVQTHLDELQTAGIVSRQFRTGRSTIYRVHEDKFPIMQDADEVEEPPQNPHPIKSRIPNKSTPPQVSHPREIGTPAKSAPPPRRSRTSPPQVSHPEPEGTRKNKKSSSNVRKAKPVDNPLPPLLPSNEKPPTPEQSLIALLAGLPRCVIDPTKDRVTVLTWIGRSVTEVQMVEAHRRALAARERDKDDRPVYVSFLRCFVEEVIAAPVSPATSDEPWWKCAEEVVLAHGVELGVRPKKPDEHWHWYRVLVARASRETDAIKFVLADAERFNNAALYQFARLTIGDALMPVDDYAS